MSQFFNDSIFWIDVDKIHPNPFQPRREFDEMQLQSLSDSIRQYGVLQALVVTRKEVPKEDGGLAVEYELIAGERRLRASKLAGLSQVPCLIKVGDESNNLMKLELAIIENIQREDLNPVDRARAFERLANEFHFKHSQIGEKVGKSREYVSNSLRLLMLPADILDALGQGKISEGHCRPLMSLADRPEEQKTLFKEIMFKKLTVREAESIARKIAYDKIRKKEYMLDPETQELEEKLTETLGTRVSIEKRENGGKISIDYFSADDLRHILDLIKSNQPKNVSDMLDKHIAQNPEPPINENVPNYVRAPEIAEMTVEDLDGRTPEEIRKEENIDTDEMYSIKNFSI
ncbi:MAG: ParB family transcriptional regulator, chromosome partitioning protein [Patescibacteria group bacterium]|nr:ParB family transcriptional regulator, chromosome partitioning protein [Patescibacteria group bacterium]